MQQEFVEKNAKRNDSNISAKESSAWGGLIFLIRNNEENLRQVFGKADELENILEFAKKDHEINKLPVLSKYLYVFVEKNYGSLKSSKPFLQIIKQYVNLVKVSKNDKLIKITNAIIKTIASEQEAPKKVTELSDEPNIQMWSSKESLCKIIVGKIPKKSKFLKYFEEVFNLIKSEYSIHDEENFESFFVRKFLIHTFNNQNFAEMDNFIEFGKININMTFDLHCAGDNQITLAHHLAQYLDCADCYHLTRRFINRINFKAVDKAGNTFMHYAVMSQWEHDLKPFIKRSDLTIKNKKGLTCVDLDRSMIKKDASSVFNS